MKVHIIGIDGLEPSILEKYESDLPNFRKVKENGILCKTNSIFPVDSVPAWETIFTGLNPAQHGIIRGLDYVESISDFEKNNNFDIKGNSFWDRISDKNKKCLIVNPFLAYPAWPINGTMISGPVFVEGGISKFPKDAECKQEAYGGYKAMKVGKLKEDLATALNDMKIIWKDFQNLSAKDNYDLLFVTFTQLDRIQHYTWRFFDENDPLHEKDPFLSELIKETMLFLDSCIGMVLEKMDDDDQLVIISDHGFGRRPYTLVNFNELFRQNGLLKINEASNNVKSKIKQKIRNTAIKTLSTLKILDIVSGIAKKSPTLSKYKKSDFLIDKENSLCYVDDLFSGKNPYCGFNFGKKMKNESDEVQQEVIEKIKIIFKNNTDLPKINWVKTSKELYSGAYYERYPDICMEMEPNYGVEFDMFTDILTKSVTHYKISGGHRNPGTFGYYSKNNTKQKIDSIEEFHDFILSLF